MVNDSFCMQFIVIMTKIGHINIYGNKYMVNKGLETYRALTERFHLLIFHALFAALIKIIVSY